MGKNQKVVIVKDGPYLVFGNLILAVEIAVVGEEGYPEKWEKGKAYPEQEKYALCRCGKSKNKPYCDGTHTSIGFDGTETADRTKYLEQAEKLIGPKIDLTDAQNLCSSARFCHLSGSTWTNVENSEDPEAKEIAIKTACNCPAGRLVVWDKKTGKPIELKVKPSISLLEDPQAKVSGPIWLKGGVELESADGTKYEIRNRMTLCRCGKSDNKPFCDGSHIDCKFNDGDESLK
ncbi:MAG: CDGSH iron-sulfur domain-containing protein [bacterium]|nr:CDGSH iron-sulfur domain-containing protein [bacterium]